MSRGSRDQKFGKGSNGWPLGGLGFQRAKNASARKSANDRSGEGEPHGGESEREGSEQGGTTERRAASQGTPRDLRALAWMTWA
jgi:hypothetical protein